MQVIKDLHDRDLYAPLRHMLDPQIEPTEPPRVVQRIQPAEAATEVGADDTPRSRRYDACNAGLFKVLAAVLFVWAAGVTVLVLQ